MTGSFFFLLSWLSVWQTTLRVKALTVVLNQSQPLIPDSCSTASSIGGGQLEDESVKKKPRLSIVLLLHILGQKSQVKENYWASEASPTLGCSIEISRDIYIYICIYICMSVCLICQINCVGGIT